LSIIGETLGNDPGIESQRCLWVTCVAARVGILSTIIHTSAIVAVLHPGSAIVGAVIAILHPGGAIVATIVAVFYTALPVIANNIDVVPALVPIVIAIPIVADAAISVILAALDTSIAIVAILVSVIASWFGGCGRGCLGNDSHSVDDSADTQSTALLLLWTCRRAMRGKRCQRKG